eukprot:1179527-Prorocentrum_minimum.AAC.1
MRYIPIEGLRLDAVYSMRRQLRSVGVRERRCSPGACQAVDQLNDPIHRPSSSPSVDRSNGQSISQAIHPSISQAVRLRRLTLQAHMLMLRIPRLILRIPRLMLRAPRLMLRTDMVMSSFSRVPRLHSASTLDRCFPC